MRIALWIFLFRCFTVSGVTAQPVLSESETEYIKSQEIKLGEDRFAAHGLDTHLYNMQQFFEAPEKE